MSALGLLLLALVTASPATPGPAAPQPATLEPGGFRGDLRWGMSVPEALRQYPTLKEVAPGVFSGDLPTVRGFSMSMRLEFKRGSLERGVMTVPFGTAEKVRERFASVVASMRTERGEPIRIDDEEVEWLSGDTRIVVTLLRAKEQRLRFLYERLPPPFHHGHTP